MSSGDYDNDKDAAIKKRLLSDASDVLTEEQEAAKAAADKSRALVWSFIAMVVIGLGNKIFQPLQMVPMYNYPLFANLLTTFVYIPTSFLYIFLMVRHGSLITAEALAVPKYKFFIMGCLDSTAGIMQTLAVDYLNNGGLVILLSQAAIPMSMAITKAFLKTKYKISQYIGAVIVTGGLFVVLGPFFENPDAGSGGNIIVWAAVMVISCIPMTLSSVYKEKALGETDIDPVYLNGWVALFQFMFAIPLLFPSAAGMKLPMERLPDNLWNGARCFVGINTITTGEHPDDCAMSPVYVGTYLSFNLCYNVLIILILKYGSSNILWLAMTIMVPLGNAAFALPFVPNHKSMHITDIIGLVLIMGGLFVYRFWAKGRHWCQAKFSVKQDNEAEEDEALSTPALGGAHGATHRRDSAGKAPAATTRAYHTPDHVRGKRKLKRGEIRAMGNVAADRNV